MSGIENATVRVKAPPVQRVSASRGTRRRSLPPAWLAAFGFVALQVPLTALAVAFELRTTWGTPEETGPILLDFLRYGSAISGPLAPQVVLLVLALLSRRGGRVGVVGTGGIGLLGLIIAFNGAMEAASEPVWTPLIVLIASCVLYVSLGLVLVAAAIRELRSHRTRNTVATGGRR